MSDPVAGKGAVITLGDGDHRVRLSTEAMIDLEDSFDGFTGFMRAVALKPLGTIVKTLATAEIDGEVWTKERIGQALTGANKLKIASDLQEYVLIEMGVEKPTDEELAQSKDKLAAAKTQLADAGVDVSDLDPTKPETWNPATLAQLTDTDSPN